MQYCGHPSCSVLVKKGKCVTHARTQDRARGTAQERGYNAQWALYSQTFRAQHPLCGERADGTMDTVNSRCAKEGRTTPAECVDHTIPISQGGSIFDPENHMSACFACNTWKAQALERQVRRG